MRLEEEALKSAEETEGSASTAEADLIRARSEIESKTATLTRSVFLHPSRLSGNPVDGTGPSVF
jgi:hypothetical protein